MLNQEQHGGSGRSGDAEEEDQPNTPGAESVEAIIKKREYVLRELVDTEEIYVTDLRLICEGYMRHMQVITNTALCIRAFRIRQPSHALL